MTYELTKWIANASEIETRLQDSAGELTEDLENLIALVDFKLPIAVDNTKLLLDRLDGVEKEYRERAQQCTKVARGIASVVEKMKMNIKALSDLTGSKEFLGNSYRMVISQSKEKLVIDEKVLKDEWKTPGVVMVPNKDAIRAALEQGEIIVGASLQPVSSLRSYFNKS